MNFPDINVDMPADELEELLLDLPKILDELQSCIDSAS